MRASLLARRQGAEEYIDQVLAQSTLTWQASEIELSHDHDGRLGKSGLLSGDSSLTEGQEKGWLARSQPPRALPAFMRFKQVLRLKSRLQASRFFCPGVTFFMRPDPLAESRAAPVGIGAGDRFRFPNSLREPEGLRVDIW